MSARRPRNAISRSRVLAVRAAELYDQGGDDKSVAATLNEEHKALVLDLNNGKLLSARTANSFYNAEYREVAEKRLQRISAARRVQLTISAAEDAGTTFAQGAQDIFARMLYDYFEKLEAGSVELDAEELNKMGKSVAKIIELSNIAERLELQRQKEEAARKVRDAVRGGDLSAADLVAEVDKIMGLAS